MGSIYHELDDGLREFIAAQHIYFVASAPLSEHGHVNVSPKGLDSLRILGPREVAYLDLTGSGIETVSHVRENGRLTLMFCRLSRTPADRPSAGPSAGSSSRAQPIGIALRASSPITPAAVRLCCSTSSGLPTPAAMVSPFTNMPESGRS